MNAMQPSMLMQSKAFAKKELLLWLRFKLPFFLQILVNPILFAILYLIIYNAFFAIGGAKLPTVDSSNFIPFIFIGTVAYTFLNAGSSRFGSLFMREKYWETLYALIFMAKNVFVIIFGTISVALVAMVVPTTVQLGISYYFYPTTILTLLYTALVLFLVLVISSSFGLAAGSFALAKENISPLVDYVRYGWVFMSCFYYPIEALPGFLHPIVMINPLYHAVNSVREMWFYGAFQLHSLLYLFACAIVMPFIAIFIFERVFVKYGIQGY